MDECALEKSPCKNTEVCVNTAGSFSCKADPSPNECAKGNGGCSKDAKCLDKIPGEKATCECKAGFYGDGKKCTACTVSRSAWP